MAKPQTPNPAVTDKVAEARAEARLRVEAQLKSDKAALRPLAKQAKELALALNDQRVELKNPSVRQSVGRQIDHALLIRDALEELIELSADKLKPV